MNYFKNGDVWSKINWNGKLEKKSQLQESRPDKFRNYFENMFHSDNTYTQDIIQSQVYIPSQDDPIRFDEIETAVKSMSKDGADFSIKFLKTSLESIMPFLILLFNCIFYSSYPAMLAMTVLNLIHKSGNYLNPKNFRPIQISKLLASLYDRILYNRIYDWMSINIAQTAYQKKRSTLNHIFIVRLLIELAKKHKKTLYIATLDLEKAFDKVPRILLFQKLARLGIGFCLLAAIISSYASTSSCLNFNGTIYSPFNILSGVKQGAASSALLFIIYIDEIIDFMKNTCAFEEIIHDLHMLLHADDALLFSFNRQSFEHKCCIAMNKFIDMGLNPNIDKCKFLVINCSEYSDKLPVETVMGNIVCVTFLKYLGVLISENGQLNKDIDDQIKNEKRSDIVIKLRNFCIVNPCCPWFVKKLLLNSCIESVILYSCETWSYYIPNCANVLHRDAIRIILGVRTSANNEIIHFESNIPSLHPYIKSRQWNFWNVFKQDIMHYENSISKLVNLAITSNIKYVKYYEQLLNNHSTKNNCMKHYMDKFWTETSESVIRKSQNNPGAKLSDYLLVNPQLEKSDIPKMFERDRQIISKYKTGCHRLKIETGRWHRIPRHERYCDCGMVVQNLQHVILHCPLLNNDRHFSVNNLSEFFNLNTNDIVSFLLKVETILRLN